MTPTSPSSLAAGDEVGLRMHRLIAELYPICRSITGDGVRQTLEMIRKHLPLQIHEVPTGTHAFDWTVPNEWNLREAYIEDASGRRVVDARHSNLHVVGYSVPVDQTMSLQELRPHLHSLPGQPELIPYRTSYYTQTWGFCLPHSTLTALAEGPYRVRIDSTLAPGSLTYGEVFYPGATDQEVLITAHLCHPSLCNDNLSGIATLVELGNYLSGINRRYGYRLLLAPATIGAIVWLARNEARVPLIRHGLVLACVGDEGKSTYKQSRRGDAEIDVAMAKALKDSGSAYEIQPFTPYGYDQRQYCSPGFDLPMGGLMRTPNGCFPEYHTSADNLDFVKPWALADSLNKCIAAIRILETNRKYLNLNPKCEPQLGRRGLYRPMGGQADPGLLQRAMLWVLNYSDGSRDLLQIADKSGLPYGAIYEAAVALQEKSLLAAMSGWRPPIATRVEADTEDS
jgi:aminopeptidase-like protein